MLAYQHGHGPMFLDTLWVNTKVKFAWPSAGLEIPSIFCSTHGPRSVLVVAGATAWIACHGQPNFTLGRWTLIPTRCSAADSAIRTTDAIAWRKMSASSARIAVHLTQRGTGAAGAGPRPVPPGSRVVHRTRRRPRRRRAELAGRPARVCAAAAGPARWHAAPRATRLAAARGRTVVTMPSRKTRKRTTGPTFYLSRR